MNAPKRPSRRTRIAKVRLAEMIEEGRRFKTPAKLEVKFQRRLPLAPEELWERP